MFLYLLRVSIIVHLSKSNLKEKLVRLYEQVSSLFEDEILDDNYFIR